MSVQPKTSHQQTPTTSTPTCSGKHTARLLVGEGNFSFAEALIKKHDIKYNHGPETSLANAIMATELKKTISCEDCVHARIHASVMKNRLQKQDLASTMKQLTLSQNDGEKNRVDEKPIQCDECISITQRIQRLRDKGVDVRLGFDGLKIGEQIPATRFKRIHWNIPHDGKNITGQTIPPIIKDFFISCSSVQEKGDRIHMAIPYPSSFKKNFYQGYVYDISTAATEAGYLLLKKRKFDQTRYPEYIHVKTNKNEDADVMKEGAREFVFIKIAYEVTDIIKKAIGETRLQAELMAQQAETITPLSTEAAYKKYSLKEEVFFKTKSYKAESSCYECSTDDDSSEYSSS